MKKFILMLFLGLFTACATFNADVPIENRLVSAQITLDAIGNATPELVGSGDLTVSDGLKIAKAVTKARDIITATQNIVVEGLPVDPAAQLELAIDALRIAQKEVDSDKARQNLGRTIAALVITQSVMASNAALSR